MTGAVIIPGTRRLVDLAVGTETLLEGMTLRRPNAVLYTNLDQLDPRFAAHSRRDIYVARDCRLESVPLVRLAPDSIVHGGGEYLVTCCTVVLREQIAPYLGTDPATLRALVSVARPRHEVDDECVLAARFGMYTWGHWLGELLPRLVLTETRHPGRFRFAVPASVLSSTDEPWPRVRESLNAYGIDDARLIPLEPDADYRFRRLHVVGPVWSDHMIHPEATALMREALGRSPGSESGPDRLALTRVGLGRNLDNADVVSELLRREGFAFHAVGRLPFRTQVDLFRSASVIFAILGSDLTGLIYARPGVQWSRWHLPHLEIVSSTR